MRENFGDDFYIVRFQQPGVADAEIAADVRATMRNALLGASALGSAEVETLPDWIGEKDIDVFVESFEKSGFTGGINWYRNIDRNWS